MSTPNLSPRNTSLDGIRGIAIALVIFHHSFNGVTAASHWAFVIGCVAASSWVGVDLFFVLSGYLITGILLKSRRSPRYFTVFYMRRFFRIFPLYYCFVGSLFIISRFHGAALGELGLGWNLLYLSNIRLALHGWPSPYVSHLWSLSVEEQFYAVWPALILLVPQRHMIATIGAMFCLLVVIRQWAGLNGANNDLVYSVLHLDGLLLGSALAVFHRFSPNPARAHSAAWLVLLVSGSILFAELLYDRGLSYWYWKGFQYLNYSLVAACGAALIGVSLYSDSHSRVNRLLSGRPLVAMGKYSYAIYILHLPFDAAFRNLNMKPSGVMGAFLYAAVLGGSSFVCACGTWKALEEPCLKLKDRWFSYEGVPARQPALV